MWYIRNSNERQLMETVTASGVLAVEAAVKTREINKRRQ